MTGTRKPGGCRGLRTFGEDKGHDQGRDGERPGGEGVGFETVPQFANVGGGNFDVDENDGDAESSDDDQRAHTLALGQFMLRHSTAKDFTTRPTTSTRGTTRRTCPGGSSRRRAQPARLRSPSRWCWRPNAACAD